MRISISYVNWATARVNLPELNHNSRSLSIPLRIPRCGKLPHLRSYPVHSSRVHVDQRPIDQAVALQRS